MKVENKVKESKEPNLIFDWHNTFFLSIYSSLVHIQVHQILVIFPVGL